MSKFRELTNILGSMKRLLGLAWGHNSGLILFTALVVAFAAMTPFAQNFAFGRLITELTTIGDSGDFTALGQAFLIFALAAGVVFAVANTLQFFAKSVLYKVFFQFFAVLIHRKIAGLEIRMHENSDTKDLITKVEENAMWRAPDFIQRMAYLSQNLLECVFATVVFMSADWRLGLLIFATSIPRLWADIAYNHSLWEVETRIAPLRREFWHKRWHLVDLRALIELKLYQNVPHFVEQLDGCRSQITEQEIRAEKRNLRWQLATLVLSEGVAILAVFGFVMQVVRGEMEIGTFSFYLASLATFRLALNQLSQNIGSQFQDGRFVHDMFEVFDMPAEPEHKSGAELDTIDEIRFDNVWFRYPGTEKDVLRGLDLILTRGQTLGLVALNGAGKSTLAKLICRMYEPTQGRILVNGRDYREYDLNAWRSKLGVVLQEFGHYDSFEVEEAVRLGRVGRNGTAGNAAIRQAASDCDAHEFIEALPQGYSTRLGRYFKNGVELSGGQYQKLAVARILFRRPELAIFDEPTSAIDGEAEKLIFQNLLGSQWDCTRILISHHFYTLKKADRIAVLEDGRISEYGSHAQLMKLGGVYARRYSAQASEYN